MPKCDKKCWADLLVNTVGQNVLQFVHFDNFRDLIWQFQEAVSADNEKK